jgi:hypothetical protein
MLVMLTLTGGGMFQGRFCKNMAQRTFFIKEALVWGHLYLGTLLGVEIKRDLCSTSEILTYLEELVAIEYS